MWDKYENISDELLAAFLDGNTTREETEMVLGVMSEDSNLMEVADITDNVITFEDKIAVWEGDYGFWELGIDPVLKPEEILAPNHEELPINEDLFLEDVSNIDFNINESSINTDNYLHDRKLDNFHSDDLSSDNDFFIDNI